jgi:hypothetical protein
MNNESKLMALAKELYKSPFAKVAEYITHLRAFDCLQADTICKALFRLHHKLGAK